MEGYQSARELKHELKDACTILMQLCDACFGPNGRCKLLVTDKEDCEFDLTSASGPILAPVLFGHPLVQMLVRRTALDQYDACGDGGWLSLKLAVQLLLTGLELETPTDKLQYLRALQDAAATCITDLRPPSPEPQQTDTHDPTSPHSLALFLDVANIPCLIALLRGFVYPRRPPELSDTDVDLFCVTLAQAFFQSLDASNPQGALSIRMHRAPGVPFSHTRLLSGVLFAFEMLPLDYDDSRFLPLPPCRTALFTESIDLPQILMKSITEETNVTALQTKYFTPLVDYLVSRSVRLVLCQKLVHPWLKHALRRKGILFLERLSIKLAAPVARMSGTRPLSSISPHPPVWDASLGSIGGIETVDFARRRYLVIKPGPQAPPTCTVICCAVTDPAAAELERIGLGAVKLLYQAVAEPFVCPGGGSTEALLAAQLRATLKSSFPTAPPPRPVRLAFEALSSGLESASLWVVPSDSDSELDLHTPQDVLVTLFSRAYDPRGPSVRFTGCALGVSLDDEEEEAPSVRTSKGLGVDVCTASWEILESSEPDDNNPSDAAGWAVQTARLLDLAASKRMAIGRAVEVTHAILRCAGVLKGVVREEPSLAY